MSRSPAARAARLALAQKQVGKALDGLIGGTELRKVLDQLPDRVFRKVVKSATAKAATPIARRARQKAPKDLGVLKKSIGKRTKVYRNAGVVLTVVGARRGITAPQPDRKGLRVPANYGHLVELGHAIVKRGSLKSGIGKKGQDIKIKGSGITLRRMPPQPFIRPAINESRFEVVRIFKEASGKAIEREAVALGKKVGAL